MPAKISDILSDTEEIKQLAKKVSAQRELFFVGRGLDYFVALEGSLKLKEITYINSQAYPAGELKHGTLALIEEGIFVIALVTQPNIAEKSISNVEEANARGAYAIGVTTDENLGLMTSVNECLTVPEAAPLLMPLLSVVPLQLLAYYTGVERGFDVDKPRNLAKSVTVE